MKMNPNGTITANAYPNLCSDLENLLLNPTDCIEELKPCHKCKNNNTKDTQYIPVRTGLSNL
jgi:hypothetical protein